MRATCPKCGSLSAWYERSIDDIFLRCMCGYCKVVHTRMQEIMLITSSIKDDVKLPREETNLWYTLMVLFVMRKANSAKITERLVALGRAFTVSDVSSYLTILRSKGLVSTVEFKRGVLGGSTWVCSEPGLELINLK